jgi:hypothetical protein
MYKDKEKLQNEYYSLLGCDALWTGGNLLMLGWYVLPPYSGR